MRSLLFLLCAVVALLSVSSGYVLVPKALEERSLQSALKKGASFAMNVTGLADTVKDVKDIATAVKNKDVKTLAMKGATIALTVGLSSSLTPVGAKLAKTGIGAAGQAVKVGGVMAANHLAKNNRTEMGENIRNRTASVGNFVSKVAGVRDSYIEEVDDATEALDNGNVTEAVILGTGAVLDESLVYNLGSNMGNLAKQSIGTAGQIIKVGGNVVGSKLAQGDGALANLGEAMVDGSTKFGNVVGVITDTSDDVIESFDGIEDGLEDGNASLVFSSGKELVKDGLKALRVAFG